MPADTRPRLRDRRMANEKTADQNAQADGRSLLNSISSQPFVAALSALVGSASIGALSAATGRSIKPAVRRSYPRSDRSSLLYAQPVI